MKVGILTYHFSDNYGALFQAYALKKWFENRGHEVCFINYQPSYVEEGGGFNLKKPFSKDNLKILFLKAVTLREKLLGNKEQKKNFTAFRDGYLQTSGSVLHNKRDVEQNLSGFQLFVCGSDQIWKPSEHFGVDPVYFLDFKQSNDSAARKISYAPSFGKSTLDIEYQKETAELIKKLDGVSVREESGVNIVKELADIDPVCVPDPTILLNDYTEIMKPYAVDTKDYVFCYALRSREAIGDVAEGVANALGAALYSPHNPHRRWKQIGETVYPCPRQWLYLLNNSKYVVTNSFHGTALSILLNKPFVVVGLQGKKETFNARVKNLLKLVGLESRLVQDVDGDTVRTILNSTINWDDVNARLDTLRNAGTEYLLNELQAVEMINEHQFRSA